MEKLLSFSEICLSNYRNKSMILLLLLLGKVETKQFNVLTDENYFPRKSIML